MLRYSKRGFWRELPVHLLYGRSDFQVISDFPDLLHAAPHMLSDLTQVSAEGDSTCPGESWRQQLGSLYNGQRLVLTTARQTQPWLQLDLHFDLFIVLVN